MIHHGIYSRLFTTPIYDFDSDPHDVINMTYTIIDAFDCECVELKLLPNSSIRVQVYMPKMTLKDQGIHQISIQLFDNVTDNI